MPPDIVFIVLDTQRADRLSCYGYPVETSPNLDRLAEEATLFEQAVAPAQWTVPTHASMFTGLYPSQHTVCQMMSVLSPTLPTLAERLQQAGYFTAGFSHNPLIGKAQNGLQRGFHTFTNYDYPTAGLLSVHLNQPNNQVSLAKKFRRVARLLLAESLGFSQQTPLHHLAPFTLPVWQGVVDKKQGSKSVRVKDSLTAVSKLLIDRPDVDQEQPIYAFINLMGTHVPYAPPQWALERFLPGVLGKRSLLPTLQKANNWQVDVRNWLEMTMPEDEYQTLLNGIYNAEVLEQDAQLGQFFTDLRQSGRFDDIFLVVVADHGDHLGEKRRLNHAFGVYEQLTHVPLIIHDVQGEFPKGQRVQSVVSTRRIFHSILSAAGTAVPKEADLSLAQANKNSQPVFSEGYPLQWAVDRLERYRPDLIYKSGYDRIVRAVYADDHKLIKKGQHHELYDVQHDANEENETAIQFPQKVEQLQAKLDDFVRWAQPAAEIQQQKMVEDEMLIEQLRNLGYLE